MAFSGINAGDWEWLKERCAECFEASPAAREAIFEMVRRERPDLFPMLETMLADYYRNGESRSLFCPGLPNAEASGAEPSPMLEAGEVVSERYLVRSFLGRGGMGEVYEVLDGSAPQPRSVALKTLRRDRTVNSESIARFEREVRNSLKVAHPNVCRMFGVGAHAKGDAELHYLTMEFLAGVTLAKRLKDRGPENPLPEAEAMPLIRQMAAGLAAIHGNGIIHGDFKPANVMLAEHEGEFRAVITDFGLSQAIAEGSGPADPAAFAFGTLEWMAPEQFGGEGRLTSAIDVYAFGATLHEMLTGTRYGHGKPAGDLLEAPVSERLREIVRRCLERDPAQRYRDAHAVVRALDSDALD